MTTVPPPVEHGGQELRRVANLSVFEMAGRFGARDWDVLQFVCECGQNDCSRIVMLAYAEFDPRSPAGAVVGLH